MADGNLAGIPASVQSRIGKAFGFLTVTGYSHSTGKRHFVHCQCSCGKIVTRRIDQIARYPGGSCGCGGKPPVPDGCKWCVKCQQIKDISEFTIASKRTDGREPYCKSCKHEYRVTYYASPLGKSANKRARASLSYKAWQRRRARTEGERLRNLERIKTELGKASRKRYYENNRDKSRSRRKMQNAILNGTIPHVKTLKCVMCQGNATEYHHHNGYAPEHALDVIPLCRKCHIQVTYPDAMTDEQIFEMHRQQQLSKSLGKRGTPESPSPHPNIGDGSYP